MFNEVNVRLTETLYSVHKRRACLKKWHRKIASAYNKNRKHKKNIRGKNKKNNEYYKILAPTVLDLYKPKNHTPMVDFVEQIKKRAAIGCDSGGAKIHICFRNTKHITASAGVWLLACAENLISNFPQTKFRVTRPPKTQIARNHKKLFPVIDSVLNRIGFYSAIGLKKRELIEVPHVKCWEVSRGTVVTGEVIGQLLEGVTKITGRNYQSLYRPLLEATANSVEHAYLEELYSFPEPHTKWWCFAAIMNNELITLICDLGVGIPKTLPKTQGKGFFEKISKLLGHPFTEDCHFIRGALQVKRSNTDLDYRGKGGIDLQSIIEQIEGSQLRILSNKGFYRVSNKKQKIINMGFDNSKSIGGTIVEWSITLPVEGEK